LVLLLLLLRFFCPRGATRGRLAALLEADPCGASSRVLSLSDPSPNPSSPLRPTLLLLLLLLLLSESFALSLSPLSACSLPMLPPREDFLDEDLNEESDFWDSVDFSRFSVAPLKGFACSLKPWLALVAYIFVLVGWVGSMSPDSPVAIMELCE
jgi:hypothetical protein